MDKNCACGGKFTSCTINTAFGQMQSITVPNGYNFPKQYYIKAFMCESCGKIELFADKNETK